MIESLLNDRRLLIASVMTALLAGPAVGQLNNLEDTDFINGLEKRGMSELLLYFVEKNPPDDPVTRQSIVIAQNKLRFADDSLDAEARRAALEGALEGYRQLIQSNPDSPRRVFWRSDFVEFMLMTALRSRANAAEFYEFGVPTEEQRQYFLDLTTEAAQQITRARRDWFEVEGELPRRADFVQKYENTGLWRKFRREYGGLRLPYFGAWANYYAALQPDDGAYFRLLAAQAEREGNPVDADAAREKMIDEALGNLERIEEQAAEFGVGSEVQALRGRLHALQGDLDAAMPDLDAIIAAEDAPPLTRFSARLAKAWALHDAARPRPEPAEPVNEEQAPGDGEPAAEAETPAPAREAAAEGEVDQAPAPDEEAPAEGEPEEAAPASEPPEAFDQPLVTEAVRAILEHARNSEFAGGNPLMLVLVTDAEHLMIRDALAGVDDPAVEADILRRSYEPYQTLLNRDAITDQRDGIETYLFTRFAEQIDPEADLSQYPAMPVLALGVRSTMDGSEAKEAGDTDEASERLNRGREVLKALLEREALTDDVRAKGLYYLGLAYYFLDRPFDAAIYLVQAASEHADRPISEQAIQYGYHLAQAVYESASDDPRAVQLYEQAATTLLNEFSMLPLAEDQRYAFAAFLAEQDRYADAVEQYEQVGEDSEFYVNAQYERLVSLHNLWLTAPSDSADDLIKRNLMAADRARDAIRQARRNATGDRARTFKQMLGDTLVMKASVLVESARQHAQAFELLDGFNERFSEFPLLIAEATQVRIRANQQLGRFDEARALIDQFLAQNPDQAGPLIKSVVDSIDRQVADLRRLGNAEEAKKLAQINRDLSLKLLEWAEDQPAYAEDPTRMMPFRLGAARAALSAGRYEEAERRFQQLMKNNPENVDVIAGFAEAKYAQDKLREAAPLYDRIIKFGKRGTRTYWNAWMQRSRISDKLIAEMKQSGEPKKVQAAEKASGKLHTTIRRLEETQDANLGGEPFKSELTRLRIKHAPR